MKTRTPFLEDSDATLYLGDAREVLRELATDSVHGCVTSPPYLDARDDYPSPTLREFRAIFRELHRVCSGTMAWNVGRIWREHVEQLWWVDLIGEAKRAGWEHRDTRVWVKPNANPIHGEVFSDHHEYVLFFGGPGRPFNTDAVRVEYQPGSIERLRRRHVSHVGVKGDVGTNGTSRRDRSAESGERHDPHPIGARAPSFMLASVGEEKGNEHPAPMPLRIADELVLVTTWPEQVVIDPFAGGGTTLRAARRHGRLSIGVELDERYAVMAARALGQLQLDAELLPST